MPELQLFWIFFSPETHVYEYSVPATSPNEVTIYSDRLPHYGWEGTEGLYIADNCNQEGRCHNVK